MLAHHEKESIRVMQQRVRHRREIISKVQIANFCAMADLPMVDFMESFVTRMKNCLEMPRGPVIDAAPLST